MSDVAVRVLQSQKKSIVSLDVQGQISCNEAQQSFVGNNPNVPAKVVLDSGGAG